MNKTPLAVGGFVYLLDTYLFGCNGNSPNDFVVYGNKATVLVKLGKMGMLYGTPFASLVFLQEHYLVI